TQERTERAAQPGWAEAATSLPCHVVRLTQLLYPRRTVMSRWLLLVALLAGCPPPEPPVPIPPVVSTGKVRVRVFTEPSPVKTIGSAGRFLFVATDDAVQRWDDAGAVLVMNAENGLPGEHVVALAADGD